MTKTLTLGLLILTLAAGCSRIAESRINPLNWFGKTTVAQATADGEVVEVPALVPTRAVAKIIDNREPIARLLSLEVSNATSGVLVTAQGQSTQSAFNAQLVTISQEGTTLTLALVAASAGQGPAQRVVASRLISNDDLRGIRTITVRGASNQLSRRN